MRPLALLLEQESLNLSLYPLNVKIRFITQLMWGNEQQQNGEMSTILKIC